MPAIEADEGKEHFVVAQVAGLPQIKHDLGQGNQHGVGAIVHDEETL